MESEIILGEIEKSIEKLSLQEQLILMERLVGLLKKELNDNKFLQKASGEKIVFTTKKSDVIGSLTREEIYDYL